MARSTCDHWALKRHLVTFVQMAELRARSPALEGPIHGVVLGVTAPLPIDDGFFRALIGTSTKTLRVALDDIARVAEARHAPPPAADNRAVHGALAAQLDPPGAGALGSQVAMYAAV